MERILEGKLVGELKNDRRGNWLIPPHLVTDLFAVSAYLCKVGGVVGFFEPDPYFTGGQHGEFAFDRDHRDNLDTAAWIWRGGRRGGRTNHPDFRKKRNPSSVPPPMVTELWETLVDCWDNPVNCGYYVHTKSATYPPKWWISALSLTVIADLAAVRPFRDQIEGFGNSLMTQHLESIFDAADKEIELADGDNLDARDKRTVGTAPRGPASLGLMADTTVACVMPKFRIAPVGTTIRNVTRNLALVPGRGEMRCCWDMTDADPLDEDKETLDILLVPAPFRLNTKDFEPHHGLGIDPKELHTDKPNWDNFTVKQSWIEPKGDSIEKFVRDCVDLLGQAKAQTRNVNGIVLPEYALTHAVFVDLCDALKKKESSLEFVVAGSADNCQDKKANTVLTRIRQKRDKNKHLTSSRRKHHRWRLNRLQVEAYGLGAVLNPKVANWWETSPVGQRELHFHRFRRDSVFAALICEELARSDVCHEILRAVGPNLVFALLMDSAQIPSRWPGQYAAALADDPGCAVLSLTSYGLVERSNRMLTNGSRSIALWKDDTGRVVTIDMPKGEGSRGVLLSLWSEHVRDQTIVGKKSLLRAWRYSSHVGLTTKGIAD